MFSFFLFLFFSYLILRSLIPKRAPPKKRDRNPNQESYSNSQRASPSERQMIVIDEMKKCPTCGTFNPKSHALEYKGKYYCDVKCRG